MMGSQHNSPVNSTGRPGMNNKQLIHAANQQMYSGSNGQSRLQSNSIHNTPNKHQKTSSIGGTSKAHLVSSKTGKVSQQMRMNQGNPQSIVSSSQQGVYKGIVHFAKSECPTPKQRVIDERSKGQTQARFFSRKNSNSGQNILVQSSNQGQSQGGTIVVQ